MLQEYSAADKYSSEELDVLLKKHLELSSSLKFLSKIEIGEKIDTGNKRIQSSSLTTSISRTLYNETRYKTYDFISNLLDESIKLLIILKRNKTLLPYYSSLCKDISESFKGILNIKTTYSGDVMFISKIDSIINQNKARINDIIESK